MTREQINEAAERQAFEDWAVKILGDNPTWRGSGDCELAWQSWQTRATLAAPLVETESQRLIGRFLDGIATAEPMFWVRLCGDGLYEGPYHHKSAEGKTLRDEKPREWFPLYLGAAMRSPHPHDAPNVSQEAGNEDMPGWRDIATAPDDLPIRLYAQGGGFYDTDFNPSGSVEGLRTDGVWCGAFWDPVHDTWMRRDDIVPTHWQPLPAAPAQGGKGAG